MASNTMTVNTVTLKTSSTDTNSNEKATNILYANKNYTNSNVQTAYHNFVNNVFALTTNALIGFQVIATCDLMHEDD